MHVPILAPETYRPRRPARSPLYDLLERSFPLFRAEYATRYAERYGPWRPVVDQTVHDYLACGDLQHGFSRVHCPRCRDVVIGAGVALTGFVLIWVKPDWLSVAGASLSTLRLLVIAIRLAANTPGGVTVPGHTRRV